MNGLNALMRYAEKRGDGLLPELRDFFAAEAEKAVYRNVVAFSPPAAELQQAGPNPVTPLPDTLPGNVVIFRRSVLANPERGGNPLPQRKSKPNASNQEPACSSQ